MNIFNFEQDQWLWLILLPLKLRWGPVQISAIMVEMPMNGQRLNASFHKWVHALMCFAVETQLILSENCECEFTTHITVKGQNEHSKLMKNRGWRNLGCWLCLGNEMSFFSLPALYWTGIAMTTSGCLFSTASVPAAVLPSAGNEAKSNERRVHQRVGRLFKIRNKHL